MSTTNDQLLARARALAPTIAARAPESEKLRKPHDETIAALIEAEILQMLVPARWGGAESDLRTMFAVVGEIAGACVSTGWIASFYINHNVYAAKFSERLQQEIFGTRGFTLMPGASAPTMKAVRTGGGWRVSGRASWGSGVMHADWVYVSGLTEEGPRAFALPFADVRVEDVWHMTGMAGTGSNDIVIENAFVPDYRVTNGAEFRAGPTAGSALYDNPLYSMPQLPLAYCTVVGVLSGGLAGMMRAYREMIVTRVRNFSGSVVKDQQHAHVTLGDLELRTSIAHDLARGLIEKVDTILRSRPFTLDDRVALKGHLAFVSQHVRDSANAIMAAAGASSFHVDQPLQRFWRDLNTVCSHAFWDWDTTRELVGRQQLGLEPNHPLV
jgi:alkylation response protein AidB-like acyl-CoA dehydrogenase